LGNIGAVTPQASCGLGDVEQATLTWAGCFNNRRLLRPIGDQPTAEHEILYGQQTGSRNAAWPNKTASDQRGAIHCWL